MSLISGLKKPESTKESMPEHSSNEGLNWISGSGHNFPEVSSDVTLLLISSSAILMKLSIYER